MGFLSWGEGGVFCRGEDWVAGLGGGLVRSGPSAKLRGERQAEIILFAPGMCRVMLDFDFIGLGQG